jgi:hypothetical protein
MKYWKKTAGMGVVAGMRYLRARGIAHRELNARNVVIEEGQNVRICYFWGLSGIYERDEGALAGDVYAFGEILKAVV